MWKTLQDSPLFYIKFNESNIFEILITDYISVWFVHFTRDGFITRLKESNEYLEFEDDDELLKQGITMLSEPDKLKRIQIIKEGDGKTLDVSMDMSFGYVLSFKYKLTKGTEQFFHEKVTKKLLEIIQDLHVSQNKLRLMLKKKDSVIKACKKKGVTITARRLKTKTFNDEDHMKTHKEFEATFGPNEVPENVLTKLNSSIRNESSDTNVPIKVEPTSIKTEPETPIYEAPTIPSVSVKQEIKEEIKTEPEPRINNIRKQRRKFNI